MSNRFTVPARLNTPIDSSDITVVILASGFRSGKQSIYEPSILFKTKRGKSVMDEVIDSIRQVLKDSDIIITTGKCSEEVYQKVPRGCRLIENQLFDITNECEDIRLALKCCITDYILIISDDFLFDHDALFSFIGRESAIMLTEASSFRSGVGAILSGNVIQNVSYGLNKMEKVVGMYLFSPKDVSKLKDVVGKENNKHKMIFELINEMIDNGCVFKGSMLTKGKIKKI